MSDSKSKATKPTDAQTELEKDGRSVKVTDPSTITVLRSQGWKVK